MKQRQHIFQSWAIEVITVMAASWIVSNESIFIFIYFTLNFEF